MRGKQAWVDAYLVTESVNAARESSKFWVYPLNTPEVNIEERLQFLKDRKFNLYLEAPAQGGKAE